MTEGDATSSKASTSTAELPSTQARAAQFPVVFNSTPSNDGALEVTRMSTASTLLCGDADVVRCNSSDVGGPNPLMSFEQDGVENHDVCDIDVDINADTDADVDEASGINGSIASQQRSAVAAIDIDRKKSGLVDEDNASTTIDDNAAFTVYVTTLSMGLKTVAARVTLCTTINELKATLHASEPAFPPPDRQRLVYGGKEIVDGVTLLSGLCPTVKQGTKLAMLPEPVAVEPPDDYYIDVIHYHGYVERVLVNRTTSIEAVIAVMRERDVCERWAHGRVMHGETELSMTTLIGDLGPQGTVAALQYHPLPNYNVEVVYNPEDCDMYNNDESPPISPRGESPRIWFEVRLYHGEDHTSVRVGVTGTQTVADLKRMVQEEYETTHYREIPRTAMKLLYQGNVRSDGEIISTIAVGERGSRHAPAIMQLYVLGAAVGVGDSGDDPTAGAGDDGDDGVSRAIMHHGQAARGGGEDTSTLGRLFGAWRRESGDQAAPAAQRRVRDRSTLQSLREHRVCRLVALALLICFGAVGIIVGTSAALAQDLTPGVCVGDAASLSDCYRKASTYRPLLKRMTFRSDAAGDGSGGGGGGYAILSDADAPPAPASCVSCEYYFPSNNHRTHAGARDYCEGHFTQTGRVVAARVPKISRFIPRRLCEDLALGVHEYYWIDAYRTPQSAAWHTADREILIVTDDMLAPDPRPIRHDVTQHLVIARDTCLLHVVVETNTLDVGGGCEFESRDRELTEGLKCSIVDGTDVVHQTVQGTLALGQTCGGYCRFYCETLHGSRGGGACCQAKLFFEVCSCMVTAGVPVAVSRADPTAAARHERYSAKALRERSADPRLAALPHGGRVYLKSGAAAADPAWEAGRTVASVDECAAACTEEDGCAGFAVRNGTVHMGLPICYVPIIPRDARGGGSTGSSGSTITVYTPLDPPEERCYMVLDTSEYWHPFLDSCRLAAWEAMVRPFPCYRSRRGECHLTASGAHVSLLMATLLILCGVLVCCAGWLWYSVVTCREGRRTA